MINIQKNEISTLGITDLDQDGQGIGHIQPSGMAVFVKDTVPGDEAEVRIVKVKKNLAYGRLEKILTPSPLRTEPLCPKARACGGCTLQHIRYEEQLKIKQEKVIGALQRIGFVADAEKLMEPITGMEEPWHFRNKMQFPVGVDKQGQPILGFYAGRTHSLIALEDCPIGHPVNACILRAVRAWIRESDVPIYDEQAHTGLLRHVLTRVGFSTGELMVCLVVNGKNVPEAERLKDRLEAAVEQSGTSLKLISLMININTEKTNRILGTRSKTLFGRSYIEDKIGGLIFRISPQSFYQVNPVQTERIYQKALEYAELTGSETVWDMYCGTGTISLFLAGQARQVYGVEIVPEAIRDAQQNALINGIENAVFYTGKAEEVVPQWMAEEGKETKIDVVMVDPPRKGMDPLLLDTLVRMAPKRLVYVSCDPATLARDIRFLSDHGFTLEKAAAFDAFCHSTHVETVACLSNKNAKPKDFIEIGVDAEDYYRIKDSEKESK